MEDRVIWVVLGRCYAVAVCPEWLKPGCFKVPNVFCVVARRLLSFHLMDYKIAHLLN